MMLGAPVGCLIGSLLIDRIGRKRTIVPAFLFTGVFGLMYGNYMEIKPEGEILKMNQFIADILGCDVADVYDELETLINKLLPKKALHEYGVTEQDLPEFADRVIKTQERLMKNCFVPLDYDRVLKIFKELY